MMIPVTAAWCATSSMKTVYLDYNATAPLLPQVKEKLPNWLERFAGNPSSIHGSGRAAREAIELARETVANLISAEDPASVYFTGSATEANAIALEGLVAGASRRRLLCSAIEHPSVIRMLESLARRHGLTLDLLPVTQSGCVDLEAARKLISSDVLSCAVMLVNNEIGTIQPVSEIAALCKENGVSLHVDAVQAAGRIPVRISELGADTLTLSAHKLGGLRGAAALYVRAGLDLSPLYVGGKQERGLRPGTENTAAILSLAEALGWGEQYRSETSTRLARLRDSFEERVLAAKLGAEVNGRAAPRVSNTTSICFAEADSYAIVQALDQVGIQCSSGSACASGAVSPSPVLLAMGLSRDQAFSSVRFSFGWGSVDEDASLAAAAMPAALERARGAVTEPA